MLDSVKRAILVLSGKGSIGKSTFSTQLALTLKERGYKVGLLDIELGDPSIPSILNLDNQSVHQGPEGWFPVYLDNKQRLGVMSIGFLPRLCDNEVVWRETKETIILKKFLEDVCWQNLDFLIINTPSGISDEHITVMENLYRVPLCGAIIVSTPQDVAIENVRKEITFCRKTGIPIIGLVENMSGYECICSECNKGISIGRGKSIAEIFEIPFIINVPMDSRVDKLASQGLAAIKELPNSRTGNAFTKLINILMDFKFEKEKF